jgi:hypothetical protein
VDIKRTYSDTAVPKALLIALAACAAIAVAGASGVVGRNLIGSGASTQATVHPAAGTVLRQDNPAQATVHPAAGTVLRQDNPAQVIAAAATGHGARTTGNQIEGDNLGLVSGAYGPDSDLTRVLPSKPAANDPGWDARSVREGHGV